MDVVVFVEREIPWAQLRDELRPHPATGLGEDSPPLPSLGALDAVVSAKRARAAQVAEELRELCGGTVSEAAEAAILPGTGRRVSAETAKYLGSRVARKGDIATAQAWFERAAGEGDPEAMLYVAEVVHARHGSARAEPLFRKAAAAGNASAGHDESLVPPGSAGDGRREPGPRPQQPGEPAARPR